MCDHDKTQNPPNNHTFFTRAKGSLCEAQRERGNIIWSAAFHTRVSEGHLPLLSCAREFLHFCKSCVYPISWVYILAGLHIRSHLNNTSISNMFSKVKS
jgi:hypothetical protein